MSVDSDELSAQVAASAISVKRTVTVYVNAMGFTHRVVLAGEARNWDSVTLNKRCRAVGAVAHDRYLANLGFSDGTYPTLEAVAANERALDF